MGMYDKITDVLYCPFCGAAQPAQSFQTKSFDCVLENRSLAQYKTEKRMFEIHSMCEECSSWISLSIYPYNS